MPIVMRSRAAVAAVVLAMLMALGPVGAARADDVVVFAAASLKNALDDAAQTFAHQGGAPVKISYAASSQLAKQIESGAPADIFISADLGWMDYVQKHNLIQPATSNKPARQPAGAGGAGRQRRQDRHQARFRPCRAAQGRAAGDGRSRQRSGRQIWQGGATKLGIWESVAPHVAGAENVRAALLFVDRKETPLGIVYATDAAADPRVEIAGVFPENTHPPIIYPIALTAASKNPEAAKLLAFLQSPAARPAFEKQGFTVLAGTK